MPLISATGTPKTKKRKACGLMSEPRISERFSPSTAAKERPEAEPPTKIIK